MDIIIIGGGPAGAAAARVAAKQGANVLIIEKKEMPRFKACGGALSEHAMSYLDFQIPDDIVDWEVYGARVNFQGKTIQSKLEKRIAVLVTRSRFDEFLLAKAKEAGAHVVWAKAKSLDHRDSHVIVSTSEGEYKAKCVILCEGANKSLSRTVRQKDSPAGQGFCIEGEIPVKSPDLYADLHGLIDLYFELPGHGYGWVFHHGSYYSIGIGGLCSKFHFPRKIFSDFTRNRGFDPALIKPVGHFIPCGGIKRKVHSGRVLLAGDAAGFVDPFYGEGLAYAIKSGQLAAETATYAIKENELSALYSSQYEKKCFEYFGKNLRYALWLTRLMHGYPSIFLHLFSTNKEVLQKYLHVPSMDLSYRQYMIWLLPRIPLLLLRQCGNRGSTSKYQSSLMF